jgi:putative pyruvate formate lyase activating enzyme
MIDTPSDEFKPAYYHLFVTGTLEERAKAAYQRLRNCDLCARYCLVDRTQTVEGAVCRTGEMAVVHSFGPHHGEERPLSGWRGSGTIFFSRCNLRCVYCQNWEISHKGVGHEVTPDEIAGMMMDLQDQQCHNINFVSPSHVVAQIISAVTIAVQRGLRLPLVYNTGGYDSLEALQLLDGIIDIYMPDMKYGDPLTGRQYSKVPDYTQRNERAVREMHRQVGDLVIDRSGIARRGLLIRHLVLPEGKAGTEHVLAFISRELSHNTYVNIMDQYYPCYRADEYQPLDHRLSQEEFSWALKVARNYGLRRLDCARH